MFLKVEKGVTYFKGTTCAGGNAPVVVEVEAYEAEDSEFEENFPAGHEPAVGVEDVAEVGGGPAFFRDGGWEEHSKDGAV